jgi:archaellum component FlaC
VTTSGDTPTVSALHSSIDNFSTAIQNLTTEAGSISERVERHSSVIDSFALKIQNIPHVFGVLDVKTSTISSRVEGLEGSLHEKIEVISNRVDILASSLHDKIDNISGRVDILATSLHDKIDNISGRVDKLAETVEKVVKCERLAMEKFGLLTKRMEHPVSFQSQNKPAVDLRRQSPLDQI